MLRPKPLLLLFLLTTASHYGQFTDVINSNRPGESMSAFSVGKTVVQAELGMYAFRQDHEFLDYNIEGVGSQLSLRYGAFFEQLEFILDLNYQSDVVKSFEPSYRRSGFKQSTIGAKFLLFDPAKNYEDKPNLKSWKANHRFKWRDLLPAVAVYAGANINLTDNQFSFPNDPKITPKFMAMTQHQFGRFVFVTNIVSDKMTTNNGTLGYVVTLTHGFHERLSAFIEHEGFQSDFYADAIFRGGAAWLVMENFQIDASIGASIKTTPSLLQGGIGVSWRFDDLYEDVLLRSDSPDKKDSEKRKQKAEKKNSKKRKDAVEGEPTTD